MKLTRTQIKVLRSLFGYCDGFEWHEPQAFPVVVGSREHAAAKDFERAGLARLATDACTKTLWVISRKHI